MMKQCELFGASAGAHDYLSSDEEGQKHAVRALLPTPDTGSHLRLVKCRGTSSDAQYRRRFVWSAWT